MELQIGNSPQSQGEEQVLHGPKRNLLLGHKGPFVSTTMVSIYYIELTELLPTWQA